MKGGPLFGVSLDFGMGGWMGGGICVLMADFMSRG